jgi:predicted CXXCH cytochrome family protein
MDNQIGRRHRSQPAPDRNHRIAAAAFPMCAPLILVLAGLSVTGCDRAADRARPGSASAAPPEYAGSAACAACHPAEMEAWKGSDHALAMQPATDATVLGDFGDARFTHFGRVSVFSKRDGKFLVRTEGPDGAPAEYAIDYVFGVDPLQQYLIAFPGGRYQALCFAWDTRPRAEGGQRWFHLYPTEPVPHTDPLHWTRVSQNWNYMCAECHSTNLRKNYDPERGIYDTTWSEIDVACEACHGPGSRHVDWAEAAGADAGGAARADGARLPAVLSDAGGGAWVFDPGARTARRTAPPSPNLQVDTCGRCHARRGTMREMPAGRPLADTHEISLLERGLYHADGQILEEVYEYASFLQSRMHAVGVRCSDCHDPHSLRLKAPGNGLCATCHAAAAFDSRAHHFHPPGAPGARCVDCHMPERFYMVVDARRDHSFRPPRPDLSVSLKTPNACTDCHRDRPASWAAAVLERRRRPGGSRSRHYGEVLDAGRRHRPGSGRDLAALATDRSAPAIARATALDLMPEAPDPAQPSAIRAAIDDPDPIVRRAAVTALVILPPPDRIALGSTRLDDPILSVRTEAARVLAGDPVASIPAGRRAAFDRAAAEFIAAQRFNADHPATLARLADFHAARGENERAEHVYREAIRIEPGYMPTYVNLADLYRRLDRDAEGEKVLLEALRLVPDWEPGHRAMGLLHVRQRRMRDALASLGRAASLPSDTPDAAYMYALALNDSGDAGRAVEVLGRALEQHPHDRSLLVALITIQRDRGARPEAIRAARRLAGFYPDDPQAVGLLQSLEATP